MTFTALSVIQPWAWLIARPDLVGAEARAAARAAGLFKDRENREWETPVRGWVLLHASGTRLAKWDYAAAALFGAKRGVDVPLRDGLAYGAAVGAMRVDGCVWGDRSPWYQGPRAFVIGASAAFAAPVPMGGLPRFFRVPDESHEWRPGLAGELAAAVRAAGLAKAFQIPEAELPANGANRNKS